MSVALATFNGATHLSEQLSSILDQPRVPEDLADDGSTDSTLAAIEHQPLALPREVCAG